MIEHRIYFDGDWGLWTHIVYKFNLENGYYVHEEIPGWLRATDEFVYDVRLFKDEYKHWATLYFKHESDLTGFLLKWA